MGNGFSRLILICAIGAISTNLKFQSHQNDEKDFIAINEFTVKMSYVLTVLTSCDLSEPYINDLEPMQSRIYAY